MGRRRNADVLASPPMTKRGSVEVARRAHFPEVAGSIPAPAIRRAATPARRVFLPKPGPSDWPHGLTAHPRKPWQP
jgi:hypothetical protein